MEAKKANSTNEKGICGWKLRKPIAQMRRVYMDGS